MTRPITRTRRQRRNPEVFAPGEDITLTFTPQLQLETLFRLNEAGRIVSTREPNPSPGPRFMLIRDQSACAWAVHAGVPPLSAAEVDRLAGEEPPTDEVRREPVHATRYRRLVDGQVDFGPAFTFPGVLPIPLDIVPIATLARLEHSFRGWTADELPERAPILGLEREGHTASVCFSSRRSAVAAEAGVETAKRFRGRGLAGLVTAAWAQAIHESGRLAIYSTSWSNPPSLAVARKLGLTVCASDWSLTW
jgi:hypothetical protein